VVHFSLKAFTLAFAKMRPVYEKRFGKMRAIELDQDTSYEKSFQRHLAKLNIQRISEKNYNKISVCERTGGLVKRHVSILAEERGKPWHAVLDEAQATWNATYVTRTGLGPPSKYGKDNFRDVVEHVYEKDPVSIHALYSVRPAMTEQQAARLFKHKPGDRVLVSLKTVSKKVRNPVSLFF